MRYRNHFFGVIFLVIFTSSVFAGGGYDPNNPGTGCDPDIPFCDCPSNANIPPCPIDGGVIALLAAGAGLGLKRMRDIKKNLPIKGI